MSKRPRKYINLKFSNGETIVESKGEATEKDIEAAGAFWTRLITGKWPEVLP